MKEELLKTLKGASKYVESVYEQERVCDGIKNTIKEIEKSKERELSNKKTIGIVAGIAVGIFCGMIFPYDLYNYLLDAGAPKFFYFAPLVAIIVPGIIVGIIVTKVLKNKLISNSKYDKQIAEQKIALQEADELYCAMAHNAGVLFPQIPPKYLADTKILQQLYDILDFGRADSWKEALNVLEIDLHNKRTEDDMKHNAYVQEQMLKTLKNKEYQAQKTADMVAMQNLFGNNNNNNNNF